MKLVRVHSISVFRQSFIFTGLFVSLTTAFIQRSLREQAGGCPVVLRS
jgi:hypothetical protein